MEAALSLSIIIELRTLLNFVSTNRLYLLNCQPITAKTIPILAASSEDGSSAISEAGFILRKVQNP